MKNADALDLPTLIAAILSTKGGVAKTTDTANLGGYGRSGAESPDD